MPGGKIAVYTGILDATKNTNGLAAVMGHEIAHAVAKHSVERASRGMLLNTGTQLIDILNSHVFDGIKSIYDEAKTIHNVNRSKSILVLFRSFLEKVPSWSNVIIESELERIIKMSKCDWLDDLLTAVFISHTKILTSIGTNNGNMIDLTIPKSINFIHKCYINVAREVWKNP